MIVPSRALVTGAAGAIGGALVRVLAERSFQTEFLLVDRDAEGMSALASELGGRARAISWDLADVDSLGARFAEDVGHAPIDLLVNCAGVMDMRSFAATSWELGARLLAIDLLAPLKLMHLVAPAMAERGGGAIVNVASMAGVVPLRGAAYYGAAKAGLGMASEIARVELRDRGVRVVTVYPGPVASGLERKAREQVERTWLSRAVPAGKADALARRIASALDRGDARVVYPTLYGVAAEAVGVARRITERWSPSPLDA